MVAKVMHSEYSICEDLDMTWRDNERIWTDNVLIGIVQHSWHICTLNGSTLHRHCGYIWLYIYTHTHFFEALYIGTVCWFTCSVEYSVYICLNLRRFIVLFPGMCTKPIFSLFFCHSPGKIHVFGGFLPVLFEYSICDNILSARMALVQAKQNILLN